jgi:hypothetical protein
MDSDIVVTQNILPLLKELDDRTLLVTEDALWGVHHDSEMASWRLYRDSGILRTRLWDFSIGRALPFTLNTGIIRATKAHLELLNCWREILESQQYRKAQEMNWQDRPLHMVGDQDVLTALLASDRFSSVPLRILRRGRDILQCMGLSGFTTFERVRNVVQGTPMFVHSQALKPWIAFSRDAPTCDFGAYIRLVYLDLSPYTLVARRYRKDVKGDTAWMHTHFVLSSVLRVLGFWYPPLVGLPIALMADCIQFWKRVVFPFCQSVTSFLKH